MQHSDKQMQSFCLSRPETCCGFNTLDGYGTLMANAHPLLVHDYFAIRGGGERLALVLAESLNATMMFGYRDETSYDEGMYPAGQINLDLPRVLRRPVVRVGALALRFSLARRQAARFDTRIFAGVTAPFAAPSKRLEGTNIYYCHTPPRFLYDQRSDFQPKAVTAGSIVRGAALTFYQREYLRAVERMDVIIANSNTVRDRVARYLGRDSIVVYPPCDTNRFRWLGQDDYYLSTARLSRLKRVDKIVDAFLKMPEKKLVVASGGDELEALRARAAGASNIHFTGWVGEEQLRELVGRSIASIYVPVEEDFGMSPVESMSAGKPVIGVREGGLRETILHGTTGTLLAPDFTADDIAAAVTKLTSAKARDMRQKCEQRASLFSNERFIDGMNAIVGHKR